MTNKRVVTKLVDDAKEFYATLKAKIDLERTKGITSSFNQTLFKSINDKIILLRANCDCGIHIPKNNIAEKYLLEYGVTNLWKINLSGGWRMIYTLNRPQISNQESEEIVVWLDVLDIVDHRKYDGLFLYKSR